jgi:peptide/nickel transport system permease protein
MVALLWGTPVALAFGFLAAVGSTLTTLLIAAIGVWFGRWVDAVIQRITEVNAILPVLPILL